MCVPVFQISNNSDSGLFFQQLVETNNKWKIKKHSIIPAHCTGEYIGDKWILFTKCQRCGKHFDITDDIIMGWRDYQFLTIAAFRQLYYSMDTIFYMLYNISYRRKIGIFYIKKNTALKDDWLWYNEIQLKLCIFIYIYISCNLSHITSACWLYINPTDSRNRLKFLEIMSRVWANFLSLLMF